MAIVANALTFHMAISGSHGIETLDQLRGVNGLPSKSRILRVWRHILTNINCWPIFTIGGTAWPNFLCSDLSWETPIVCWANTTLGLICFWWIGTRQQEGRARLTISKLPALTVLDPRRLTPKQTVLADEIFAQFRDRTMLPANEAWRDEARQALDRAVLIDLLELPEEVMEPLALLRRQWCAEPSVHGGKGTVVRCRHARDPSAPAAPPSTGKPGPKGGRPWKWPDAHFEGGGRK